MFSLDRQQVDRDWKLDDHMTQLLRVALEPQFDLRPVDFDRPRLWIAQEGRQSVFAKDQPFQRELRRQLPPGSVDIVLLVTVAGQFDKIGWKKFGIGGYGTYVTDSPLYGRVGGHAFLVCAMSILDGRTYERLGGSACLAPKDDRDGPPIPYRKLDEAMTKTPLSAYSPAQQAWLRDALHAIVADTVPPTLAKLKLTQVDPGADADKPAPERPPQEESTR